MVRGAKPEQSEGEARNRFMVRCCLHERLEARLVDLRRLPNVYLIKRRAKGAREAALGCLLHLLGLCALSATRQKRR
jgi:hypothetical protein